MDQPPDRSSVRATYDRIAGHFAKTREYPWPEVESFVEDCDPADVAIDIGCGNGRHAELLSDHARQVLAVDVSQELLREARGRLAGIDGTAILQGDAATLPVRDNSVEVAVYVATLHHLPERDRRIESLNELASVLTSDGRALVSAWSTAHDQFEADTGFDTTVDWTLPGGETVPRYYHIYDPEEFREDLAASDLDAIEVFVSSGNCYAAVEASE